MLNNFFSLLLSLPSDDEVASILDPITFPSFLLSSELPPLLVVTLLVGSDDLGIS